MAASIDQSFGAIAGAGNWRLRYDTDSTYVGHAKFTPTVSAGVSKLEIGIGPQGSPSGNVWAEIWTDSSGSPGTKVGGSSANVACSSITVNNFYDFTWSSNYPQVASGTTYWIVLRGDYSVNTTNYTIPLANSDTGSYVKQSSDGSTWGNALSNWKGVFKEWSDTALLSSPSSSPSLSPSSSESRSPSASQSPSSSASLSISLSPSLSESRSISLSPSVSVSSSPSLSPSVSVSPSPSIGYSVYTRGDYAALPGNDSDLETVYTGQEEINISTKDGIMVDQTALSQYMIHQFKDFVGDNTTCQVEWYGQTTLSPATSTVYLQIFNRNTNTWDILTSDNSSPIDTNFSLQATIADLTNYKDASNVISCRVYQLSTP